MARRWSRDVILWTDPEAFLVSVKGCMMLARAFKAKNLEHITCLPVPSELQVVSISSLIWMFLKPDQVELGSAEHKAAFSRSRISNSGRTG